jgi:hypothetical protein
LLGGGFDGGVRAVFNRLEARREYRPNARGNATGTRLRRPRRGASLTALRLAMTRHVLTTVVTCAMACGGLALFPAGVHAQPAVRVRAESRIELRTEREGGRVVVVGVLRDDLGEALADREVTLRARPTDDASGERRTVRTDEEGRLRAEFALAPGAYRLGAIFVGDPDHERVEVERALDLDRADVRLRVTVPEQGRLRLDVPQHVVDVVAESAAGGAGLRVELADELGRSLGRATTDAEGRARFVVRSAQLGPPAAGRLIARGAADALRADAQTEVPIVRVSPTRVDLRLDDASVRLGEQLRGRGRLIDHAGRALPREAVGLFDRGQHLATVLTGEDGTFEVRAEANREGALQLVARYDSDAPWRGSSASPIVRVEVSSASERPLGWLVGTVALTAVALLLLKGFGRRRPALAPPPAPVRRTAGVESSARRGRAERVDVGGTVLDLRDDEPLLRARVTLHASGEQLCEAEYSSAHGFAIKALAHGTYELRVEAAGYVSVIQALVIPHRGEWGTMRVRLDSLRDRALDAVVPVAAELLPQRAWGTATPREVLERARAQGVVPSALPELASRAERAAYSPEPPTPADLEATEQARDDVLGALRDGKSKSDARR